MGFEIQRFKGDVRDVIEELTCSICLGVLEDPVQLCTDPPCDHVFCRKCVWDSDHESLRISFCPEDKRAITDSELRSPRIISNILSRLRMSCDNAPHGCNAVLELDALASHLLKCEFDPKRSMPCEAGCGLMILRAKLAEHNCVRELRAVIEKHKGQLVLLEEFMQDQKKRQEVVHWASSLKRMKVTDWAINEILQDPDDILKEKIKKLLSYSDCPPHIVDELVKKCDLSCWPSGTQSELQDLKNDSRLPEYVCRELPGMLAVLVLHCDNTHMGGDMVVEPGFVVIFEYEIK